MSRKLKLAADEKTNILKFNRNITNISDYIEALQIITDEVGAYHYWFRGMSNKKFKLEPSATREENWKYCDIEEHHMIADFIHRARNQINERHDIWGWYSICQHHGIPTRLLDWSESALTALYFAVEDKEDGENPAIWVLNPWWLNEESCDITEVFLTDSITTSPSDLDVLELYKVGSKKLPNSPIAIIPPYIDKRMSAQKACFTVHGTEKNSFEELSKQAKQPFLIQITIRPDCKSNIRADLHSLGVDTSSIYPDLDGLAKAVTWNHKNNVFLEK
ncbi:hypothetical protein BCU97_09185 [Vibrio splendidus]|uniref:FRG domain-containing protein n=1 Tax=Vibrio splendidus TaxID=29497 RepID=UPI000C836EE5|nr:FRG domain-containing protein [Vibrio splendidus]PMG38175.1 hypothetical protein BCU97_09185 [Vibrio splendidus]